MLVKKYTVTYIVHKQGVSIPCVVSRRKVLVSPLQFLTWHGYGFGLLRRMHLAVARNMELGFESKVFVIGF